MNNFNLNLILLYNKILLKLQLFKKNNIFFDIKFFMLSLIKIYAMIIMNLLISIIKI